MSVHAIPQGLSTLTTQLTVNGATEAIAWFQKAFGAEVRNKAMDQAGKKVMHAEVQIGQSVLFINDNFPEFGDGGARTQPINMWLYSDNVDQAWKRAIDAGGAKIVMELQDQFWGDRSGTLVDPFGNRWNLAQHMKDLTPDELKKAEAAFFKK